MHTLHGPWILVENDPGVPHGQLDDVAAGLDAYTAAHLRRLETCLSQGAELSEGLLLEAGKQIGTAQLSANVLTRDSDMRMRHDRLGLSAATMQRSALRLASQNAAKAIEPVQERARRELGGLMSRWLNGGITLTEMRRESATELRRAYEGMRAAGRAAAGLDRLGADPNVLREEETWFRDAIREELGYWNAFLDDVEEGRTSPARAQHRLESYVKALRYMYDAARTQALPDSVLLYWMGPKKDDPNICEGCVKMMEWSPFTKMTIPAVPRDGSTPCLTNCRHRVVVRVAKTFNEVVRRNSQLDKLRIRTNRRAESSQPRARMVQKLNEIRDQAHGGRSRQRKMRGQAGNPFRGERLPGVPKPRSMRQRMRDALGEGVGEAPDELGRETIGVFIPVPAKFRKGFPEKKEDPSDPHCTMLYVGKATPADYRLVVTALESMIVDEDIQPFTIEMTDYGEFETPDGKVIAHMIPRGQGMDLGRLHDMIHRYLTAAGVNAEHHREGAFKPHVTLEYRDKPGYTGPRPQGIWRCGGLEVWGAKLFGGKGQLGRTFVPFQAGAPAVVTEASIRATPYSNFDQAPYSTMDLRDVARLLQKAAERRDVATLLPLLERLIGALETTVIAVEGRPRGMQVARMFRAAFLSLADALGELPESVTESAYRLEALLRILES